MREAVIVSTARTGIGRAFRGALNNIKSPTLTGHAIRHAVQRAGIDPGEIEDVVIGTALAGRTAGTRDFQFVLYELLEGPSIAAAALGSA